MDILSIMLLLVISASMLRLSLFLYSIFRTSPWLIPIVVNIITLLGILNLLKSEIAIAINLIFLVLLLFYASLEWATPLRSRPQNSKGGDGEWN